MITVTSLMKCKKCQRLINYEANIKKSRNFQINSKSIYKIINAVCDDCMNNKLDSESQDTCLFN